MIKSIINLSIANFQTINRLEHVVIVYLRTGHNQLIMYTKFKIYNSAMLTCTPYCKAHTSRLSEI
uniref:Uncharacterized protein n=1 Tax=Arion vulgaris TaxID=1028688 RepID=A0A0B7AGR9_9EUPU